MKFPVVWLMPDVPREHVESPYRLTWAQAQVEQILTRAGGQHLVGFEELPDHQTGAAVVIPAEYYLGREDWVRNQLHNLDWVVLLVTSDEASKFPLFKLSHPNMRMWVQTPHPGRFGGDRERLLGFGLPPETTAGLGVNSAPGQVRGWDWCFSGQVNHERRRQCLDVLQTRTPGEGYLRPTEGFSKGLYRPDYLKVLARTKVVACPAGPATPDTFRAWEAMEAGSVPVVDVRCPAYISTSYWRLILGEDPPFPTIGDWSDFPAILEAELAKWPANANRIGAWWAQYQRRLAQRIIADIAELSGHAIETTDPTVLVSTSSIPSHPDTGMIEATIDSVRTHLPHAEIIVMCDGIRPEQEHRRGDYEAYLQRLTWLCRHRWAPAVPVLADDHQHQANMTRRALTMVDTATVLYMEHDTPLVTDLPIDWDAVQAPILADELDVVRFHFEATIPEPHRYLMIDQSPTCISGCPVIRTRQFSQRPHVASTQWYRQVIEDHFPPTCRTFIEDKLHSVCQTERRGRNRLAIYAPGPNLKRSLNLDGRKDDPKADCVFA